MREAKSALLYNLATDRNSMTMFGVRITPRDPRLIRAFASACARRMLAGTPALLLWLYLDVPDVEEIRVGGGGYLAAGFAGGAIQSRANFLLGER